MSRLAGRLSGMRGMGDASTILNPYNFANLSREQRFAVLKQMSPRDMVTLTKNFKMVMGQQMAGLGNVSGLASWFSDVWREVAPIVGPIVSVVAPEIGIPLMAASQVLFPNKAPIIPPATQRAATGAPGVTAAVEPKSSMLPIVLGVGALLLLSGGRRR